MEERPGCSFFFVLVLFHTHALQQFGSHFLLSVSRQLKMFFSFFINGCFGTCPLYDKPFPVTVSAGYMFVTVICNGPGLGKSHLFFCGTMTENLVFCKSLAANEPTPSGYYSLRFHQKDELSHGCQNMK